MDPNTLPNQPAPEAPQPTPVAAPVQQPVLPTQPVFQSNPTGVSPKMDKSYLIVGIFIGLLIIGGVLAYYSGSSTNNSSSSSSTLTRSQVAKSTEAQTNAYSVQSVAEVYAADNTYYPSTAAEFMSYNKTISLPKGINVLPDSEVSPINTDNGTDSVAWSCFKTCTNATGGKITYWDYKTNAVSTSVLYVGDAYDSSTFVNPEF